MTWRREGAPDLVSRVLLAVCVVAWAGCATGIRGGVSEGRYTSPRAVFTITIPTPRNFGRVPFEIFYEGSREGPEDFEEVAFLVKDFGEMLLAGVARAPDDVLRDTASDDQRTLRSNAAYRALGRWRGLPVPPTVEEDTYLDTAYGEALLRVYLAKRGSALTRTRPREGIREPEHFDTLIAVVMARRNDTLVYAIAQNDYLTEDGKNGAALKRVITEFFSGFRVK